MKKALDPEVALFFEAASQRKVEDLMALDLRGVSSIADFFIIGSGKSTRQVIAIAEDMQRYLKEHGRKALSVEGTTEGTWVVIDYGNIIVHLFYGEIRSFYDLEGLWSDAPILRPPKKRKPRAASKTPATEETPPEP